MCQAMLTTQQVFALNVLLFQMDSLLTVSVPSAQATRSLMEFQHAFAQQARLNLDHSASVSAKTINSSTLRVIATLALSIRLSLMEGVYVGLVLS